MAGESRNESSAAFMAESQAAGEDEGTTNCGDCLNIKRAFTGSPKIVVWTAVEEVAKLHKAKAKKKKSEETKKEKGFLALLISGIILFLIGVITFVWTPYEIVMNERLKMLPGFPAFEWWKNPPDEVLLRMYVFNITNSQEFMNGSATKLNLQEIGPYIFREKLWHKDIKFNDNGTLTYTAVREAIFLPEMNSLSLNDTIIVPNLAVLGISSYLWDTSFATKIGFNFLLNRMASEPIVSTTVYNYFWNFSDPIMKVAMSLAPHLVPEENMGVLHQIYKEFTDEVTVFIGPDHGGRNFFTIDKYHGRNGLGSWENETCDSVKGSTEGVTYHQKIKRSDELKYLRKTICRAASLHYKSEETIMGMTAYRFELANDTFVISHSEDGNEGCFNRKGFPALPTGLTDVSPCYYDFPIASSFPHFMYADPSVTEKISGLDPDPEKHGSFVIVEPNTGVPFNSRARSQSSLIVRSMRSFPRFKKFSNMAIPMFWAEYNQVGLPWYVSSLMYFTAIIVPSTQTYSSCALIVISSVMIFLSYLRINKKYFRKYSVTYNAVGQNSDNRASIC